MSSVHINSHCGKNRHVVLVNALHAKSGGGLTYLNNILPRLASDIRLDIHICVNGDQVEALGASLDSIHVHVLPEAQGFLKTLIVEQRDVPNLARSIAADVLFSPANFGPVATSGSVILLRNALSVGLRDWRPHKLLYWLALFVMTVLCAFRATRVIAVSKYAARQITPALLKLVLHKTIIVPHGVSEIFFKKSSENFDLNKSAQTLLAVSDIYVQKNLHTLIDAFALLRKKYPELVLEIAGARVDEGYAHRIEQKIAKHGLGASVRFLGTLEPDTLVEKYQACTIFVFPSTVETFGNPLVEAMACGASIACAQAAAMPEIASDGVCYFDPDDAKDIMRILAQLLDDPDERRRLSELGRKRAAIYDWDRTAKQTADILIEAASYRLAQSDQGV